MQYGIRSVSMDDVCRHLGISKKTLYEEVTTKRDLVRLVVEEHQKMEFTDMERIMSETEDALEAMVNIGQYIIQLVRSIKPSVIYDLQKYYGGIFSEFSLAHTNKIHDSLITNMNKGIEQGYYRSEIDVEVIARLYAGKVQLIMNDDVFPSQEFKQEHVVRQHLFYHMHGILTKKGIDKLYNENILNKKLEA